MFLCGTIAFGQNKSLKLNNVKVNDKSNLQESVSVEPYDNITDVIIIDPTEGYSIQKDQVNPAITYEIPTTFSQLSNINTVQKNLISDESSTFTQIILPGRADAIETISNLTGTNTNYEYGNYEGDYNYDDMAVKERDDDKADPITAANVDGKADAYPWLSADGLRLYYTHENEDGLNAIYFCSRPDVNTPFGAPSEIMENVGSSHAISCWLTNDELDIYYIISDEAFYHAHRNSTEQLFGEGKEVELKGKFSGFTSDPSFSPDMNELYMYNGSEADKILVFNKQGNKYVLKGELPTLPNLTAAPGQITKDGLTFYLSMKNSELENEVLYKLTRPAIGAEWSMPVLVEELNNMNVLNLQPCFSADNKYVVFVRNTTYSWYDNELYFTNLGQMPKDNMVINNTELKQNNELIIDKTNEDVKVTEVIQNPVVEVNYTSTNPATLVVYPNPSTTNFNFSYKVAANKTYTLKYVQ